MPTSYSMDFLNQVSKWDSSDKERGEMAESGWAGISAPMASAGFACELFSNNPRWDSDAEQDDMPSVIWDIDGQMGQARWASTGTARKSTALARHGHDTIVLVPARGTI
jgi:hypothetical protein